MSARLRPIETVYAGVRFRSRQEARWAILFDRLGLEWQYEAEGYQLPSQWYLPDFWLPGIQCFAEINGITAQWTTEALRKATELAIASGKVVILCDEMDPVLPLIPALWPHAGEADRYFIDLPRSRVCGRPWHEPDPDDWGLDTAMFCAHSDEWIAAVDVARAEQFR
jgi:hypothetical protein